MSYPMYSVIIAGGGGQRLWPLSTPQKPKPLLEIGRGETLLGLTLKRAKLISPLDKILLVITEEIREPLLKALPADFLVENVLIEPMGRNTAPAAALAAEAVRRREPEAVMALFPADHLIENTDHFAHCLKTAGDLASKTGDFVLLGLKPAEPSSEYGYILLKERYPADGIPVYRARGFLEKPPMKKATELIAESKALWNSGIYVAPVSKLLGEIRNHLPLVYDGINRFRPGSAELKSAYHDFPSISLDYAVTEKLPSFLALATSLERVDVGHLNSFHGLWDRDEGDNAVEGSLIQIDSSGNIVHSPDRPVALLGIKDTVVVATPEALLVCPRDQLHRIREIREKWIVRKKGENHG